MGPGAPPAQAQERRAPTNGAALLQTGSGPALTRLLSYDAVMVGRAQTRQCRGATTEGVPAIINVSGEQARVQKSVFQQDRTSEWGQSGGSREGETRRPTVPWRPMPSIQSIP